MAFSRLSRISTDFLFICSFLLPLTTAQWLENNIIGPTCQGNLVEYGNLPEYRSVVAECNAEPNYCRSLCIFSKLGMLNNHGSYMPAKTKYLLQQLLTGRNAEKAYELSGAFQSCSASFNYNVHLSVYQGCSSYNRLLNCFRQSAIMICEGIRAQDLLREDATLGWPVSLIPPVFRGGTVSNVYGPPAVPSANSDTRVPYNSYTPISQYQQTSPNQYSASQQQANNYSPVNGQGNYYYPGPQSKQLSQGPNYPRSYQSNQRPQATSPVLSQTLPQGNAPQLMNQYNAQPNMPLPQQVQQSNLQQMPLQVNRNPSSPSNPEPPVPQTPPPPVNSPPHPQQQLPQQPQPRGQQNQLPQQNPNQQSPELPQQQVQVPEQQQQVQVPEQQQQVQVPEQQQQVQLQEQQQQPTPPQTPHPDEELQNRSQHQQAPQHLNNAHHPPPRKGHPHNNQHTPPTPVHHQQQMIEQQNEPQPVQPISNNNQQLPVQQQQQQVQLDDGGPPPPPGNGPPEQTAPAVPGNGNAPELVEPYGEGSFTFLARMKEPTHHEQQQQSPPQDNPGGQQDQPQQNPPQSPSPEV